MKLKRLWQLKSRYCAQCEQKDTCKDCKVPGFIRFVQLQETSYQDVRELMRTNEPTDITKRQGKYTQNRGDLFI